LVKRTLSGSKVRRIEYYARTKWEKEEYEQETRNGYFEMMRQQREFENARPTTVLEDLISHTPKRAEGTILRISVPNNAVPALLFDADENILEIKHRTGCDIDLLEAEDNKDSRILLLSGPSVCVTMAAARIFEVVPDAVTKSTNPVFIPPTYSTRSINDVPLSEKKDASLVKPRYYLTYANDSITTAPRRADSIPQPDKWTSTSLEAYVRSLTRMKMTNHIHRLLYQKDEEHQEIVRELLEKIFDLDECMEAMTVTTVNEALSFLMKYHKIPQVCDIFGKAQLSGFRMNTESFNIMLRGAAKIRDLNTFGYLIRIMVRLGYRPNSGTWLAFMSVLDNPKAMWRLFTVMRERGLFHEEGLMTDVCSLLVPHELRYCLGKEKPMLIPEFIVYMTKRYGESWLTLSGANRMLDELAIRGLMSECWLMIEHMISRNITPNVVSVNTILTHCSRLDGLKAAAEFFQRLTKLFRFKPDAITYTILLRAAWDACCYATSRTVWQYACLDACVPWQMRRRVGDAVIASFQAQNSANPSLHMDGTPATLWECTAGLFVVTEEHKNFPVFVPPVPDMPLMSFENARLHAEHALKADLNLFRRWKPAQSFSKLLEDSITVDTGFRTMEGKSLDERMQWLLKYAPVVKRKKRNYELNLRSTDSYFKRRIVGYYSDRGPDFRAFAARNYWKEKLRRAARWKNDRWIRSVYSEPRPKPKPQFNKNEPWSRTKALVVLRKAKRQNLTIIGRDPEFRTPAEIIAERALLIEKREMRAIASTKYFQGRPAMFDEKVPLQVVHEVTSMPETALTTPQEERGQMATQKPPLSIMKREDATHGTHWKAVTESSGIMAEGKKKKGISKGRKQGQEERGQVTTQKAPLSIKKREKRTPGTHWKALAGSCGITTEKEKEKEVSEGRKQGQKKPKIAPRKSQESDSPPKLVRKFGKQLSVSVPLMTSITLQEKFNYIATRMPPPLVRRQCSGPLSRLEKAIVRRQKRAQKKAEMAPKKSQKSRPPRRLVRKVAYVSGMVLRKVGYVPGRKAPPRHEKRVRMATGRSPLVVSKQECGPRGKPPKMARKRSSVVD